jgi:superfamily II DNA helicase RecQ
MADLDPVSPQADDPIRTERFSTRFGTDPLGVRSSDAVLETLETILAPGRRARLSPYVEAAQAAVLFRNDEHSQTKSRNQLVEEQATRITAVAARWRKFADAGKRFADGDYADEDFLDTYLAYYFSVNVPKVQMVLLDLLRAGHLPPVWDVLDVGVGTGTTAVAVLDFLLAWAHTCELHGEPFPVTSLRLRGVDRSASCLRYAMLVVYAYADALRARIQARLMLSRAHASTDDQETDSVERVYGWATSVDWQPCDLVFAIPSGDPPNLVVLSNVLCELGEQAQANLERFLADSSDGALVIAIEPGDQKKSRALMRWRRTFVASNPKFVSLVPCGQEFGRALPWQCETCWNARRESFHRTALYTAFQEARADAKGDKHSDDFDNDLLSWSYTVLGKQSPANTGKPLPSLLKAGANLDVPTTLRFLGVRRGDRLVSEHPDERDRDLASGYGQESSECLQLCPGSSEAHALELYRPLGFQVPNLRHGQEFTLCHARVEQTVAGGLALEPRAQAQIAPVSAHREAKAFLQNYGSSARRVVDEFAYRLFGFPALHEFQHTILAQVLRGKPVLGVAATGGGKSECFILPSMLLPGITVVVSPLKALMDDQYEMRIRHRYGLHYLATTINGDVKFSEREARLTRMEQGYYKLVYVTPEQLERQWVLDSLRRANENVGVTFLAMDEAHCISQWGHDFRPAYLNLLQRLRDKDIDPIPIALTATASPFVRDDICDELGLEKASLADGGNVHVESSNRPELNLIVRHAKSTEEKVDGIVEELQQLCDRNKQHRKRGETQEAAIVFMPWAGSTNGPETKDRGPDRENPRVLPFASYLEHALGERVAVYHSKMDGDDQEEPDAPVKTAPLGDMSRRTRQSEQRAFVNGELDDEGNKQTRAIMVATKGFGMGVDKSNIRRVIHRTLPGSLEAYAQEAGRAGRDRSISDVILFYTPSSKDASGAHPVGSDVGIQDYFREGKYVREEDVRVMEAFLRRLRLSSPAIAGHLYFTNDQVFEFIEECKANPVIAGLGAPYQWHPSVADLPQKSILGKEDVLRLGYLYRERTKYVSRILQVLYQVRPRFGERARVAFLDQVFEAGTVLTRWGGLGIDQGSRIVGSNSYFGALLRDADVTAEELAFHLLPCSDKTGNLSRLARRLGRPIHEIGSILSDIRAAKGRRLKLIDFGRIAAPRLWCGGDKIDADTWRGYAGAVRARDPDQAHGRARFVVSRGEFREWYTPYGKSERVPRPTLDDWFDPSHLSTPTGWEVRLGPAFDGEQIEDYLQTFIRMHDDRMRNDREAFRLLLSGYVGANEDGTLNERQSGPRYCLRETMLGYLKTYEVTTGNCSSCSVCVPDGRFETCPEKRQRAVVRLGQNVEEKLRQIEECVESSPPSVLIAGFWNAVSAEEERLRHSMAGHLNGWSIKLLGDTNGNHRGALWTRLVGMARGILDLQPDEFIGYIVRLNQDPIGDAHEFLWDLLDDVLSPLQQHPAFHEARAQLAHRLRRPRDEETAWKSVLDNEIGTDSRNEERLRRAHGGLCSLYDPAVPGNLADPTRYLKHAHARARLSRTLAEAVDDYRHVASLWSRHQLRRELDALEEQRRPREVSVGLLQCWLESSAPDSVRRAWAVAAHLTGKGRELVSALSEPIAATLIDTIGAAALEPYPPLAATVAREVLKCDSISEARFPAAARLALASWPTADTAEEAILLLGRAIASENCLLALGPQVIESFRGHRDLVLHLFTLSVPQFRATSVEALGHWFHAFPADLHLASPNYAKEILRQAADLVAELPKGSRLPSRTFLALQTIVQGLVATDTVGPQIHSTWLRLGRVMATRVLGSYVAMCLRAEPPQTERAEEVFGMLVDAAINKGVTAPLQTCMIQLRDSMQQVGPRRIRDAVTFFVLCENYVQDGGQARSTLQPSDFACLRRVFIPESVDEVGDLVSRADMLAAAIRFFRELLPSGDQPPPELVEALCLGNRFEEAELRARQYPDLLVGPQAEPAQQFVRRMWDREVGNVSQIVRNRDDSAERDYRAILHAWVAQNETSTNGAGLTMPRRRIPEARRSLAEIGV